VPIDKPGNVALTHQQKSTKDITNKLLLIWASYSALRMNIVR